MVVARLSYLLIAGIVSVMAVAIYIVLNPDDTEEHPAITIENVINYSKLGAVERIEVRERTLLVTFKDDFPTNDTLGTDSRTFEAPAPTGQSISSRLEAAGVVVGDDGVRVENE